MNNTTTIAENSRYQLTGRLSTEELSLAYDKLWANTMTKEEISIFARDIVDEGRYPRTAGSAIFVLNRMHVLIHGLAPEGETQSRADTMFRVTQTMIDYVISRDDLDEEDIETNIGLAKEELANRPVIVKIKHQDAVSLMSDYYKKHKNMLPKNISQYREAIIEDIMNNLPVDQAFSNHVQ